MLEYFSTLFLALNSNVLFFSPKNSQWEVKSNWVPKGEFYIFEAESDSLYGECQKYKNAIISLPSAIHSVQELFQNNTKIYSNESRYSDSANNFFVEDVVPCSMILNSRVFWRIKGYSKYFSRISYFPTVKAIVPLGYFLTRTLNVLAVGIFLCIALAGIMMFARRYPTPKLLSFVFSNLFFSFYFSLTNAQFFGISGEMIFLHKMADLSLYIGAFFVNFNLFQEKFLPKILLKILTCFLIVAFVQIIFGKNGDQIQAGTSFPFLAVLVTSFVSNVNIIKSYFETGEKKYLFMTAGNFIYFLACLNDIFVVSGFFNFYMCLPLGLIGISFFFLLSVNASIEEVYKERDFLRLNLEKEVERKTLELKTAQAELVQNAKLASLGTLAAGIAHEINNSLNYVNGSVSPMKKLIGGLSDEGIKKKLESLIGIIQHGLQTTFDIIGSLKSFSGLNSAKFNDSKISEIVKNSLVILKNKIPLDVQIEVSGDSEISVFCNTVGVNQVVMNLIGNAVDAMEKSKTKKLEIIFSYVDEGVEILFRDQGSGMSEEVMNRIFDPFFTTKDVGKGTGLGLHICKKEIDRHGGSLTVKSTVGVGTEFRVWLPKEAKELAA